MGLFSKSEQLKAVSKAAIVPGLFNINEPVIFGYPIMYNPIMCIPFILNPVITMIICYFGYMIGFFQTGLHFHYGEPSGWICTVSDDFVLDQYLYSGDCICGSVCMLLAVLQSI